MVLPIIYFSSTEATNRPLKHHKTGKKKKKVGGSTFLTFAFRALKETLINKHIIRSWILILMSYKTLTTSFRITKIALSSLKAKLKKGTFNHSFPTNYAHGMKKFKIHCIFLADHSLEETYVTVWCVNHKDPTHKGVK